MRGLPFILTLLLNLQLDAQDLWLRPDKYFYNQNETARVDVLTGENFIGVPGKLLRVDVTSLDMIYRRVKIDIRRNFSEAEKAFFTASLTTDGIYSFLMQTKKKDKVMSRNQFWEYAKQYGFESAQVDSTSTDHPDSVTISVTYNFKSYVRVGKQFDKRPELPSGLPLEIIPDKNPLVLKRGERISLKILKEGKPAFGVRVRIWNRWDNRTTMQHIYTLQDGTVSTTVSSPGDWMVTVIDIRKSIEPGKFEADSYNLIFGYR
jgi:hypothetical protein